MYQNNPWRNKNSLCSETVGSIQTTVSFLLFKGRIRCSYTGGLTPFIHSDFIIRLEAAVSYFKHVTVTNMAQMWHVLINKLRAAVAVAAAALNPDCVMVGQRVQQKRTTSLPVTEDECCWLICFRSWCSWLLEGMGVHTQIGLIYVPC